MQELPQLCPFVEGVLFTVEVRGRMLRGLVLREPLQLLFGATAEAASWLRAYGDHRADIDAVALQQALERPVEPEIVVLRERDFAAACDAGLAPGHFGRPPRPSVQDAVPFGR